MNKERVVWSCPDCPWEQSAHPVYGWQAHNERAVVVHQTMLCPALPTPPVTQREGSDQDPAERMLNLQKEVCVTVDFCSDKEMGRECSHRISTSRVESYARGHDGLSLVHGEREEKREN